LARWGGDEFTLVIPDYPEIGAIHQIADNICKSIGEPFVIRGNEIYVTASIGISLFPEHQDEQTMLKNADMAMYEAKKKGKNQYQFCNEDMKQDATRKMMLTNSLYKAMEREELFLHYQPQVHVETGAVVGLEALLRWKSADYGMIPPGTFIPLAEQTGLIRPIGLWVFKSVCEECRNCSSEYKDNIRISVNFSAEQLKDGNLVEHLSGIIRDTEINPRKIQIEITESVAFSKDTAILEKLMQLKELGLQIAIDDFGKDYSALNRIRSCPVDLLKIDMDFIRGLSYGSQKDRAIVKTIIQLAKNLGIKVLAEGVETEEQYEFLKQEKCDEIQGFYFYKGMPASEVKELLISGQNV
jgi:predicted signal transduction protein with EAL and GGDEF domain